MSTMNSMKMTIIPITAENYAIGLFSSQGPVNMYIYWEVFSHSNQQVVIGYLRLGLLTPQL